MTAAAEPPIQQHEAQAAQAQPTAAAPTDNGAAKLLDRCLKIEKDLEGLATSLAQAGADPGAVKAVTQMAHVIRQMCSALGKAAGQPAEAGYADQQPQTMSSATNSMTNDLRAKRQGA